MNPGKGIAIEVKGLSKRFGPVEAVENLTFRARPGAVTGFLGPNGSGKSTTLRMILGLVRPDAGNATVGGVPYSELREPTRVVGAVLDSARAHPAMKCTDHLELHARLSGHPRSSVERAVELTGVETFASRRVHSLSTGMRQRLALATALLGDPEVLILDEPSNGLDPQGMAWLRNFLEVFARDGRTVLLSSHVLSEIEQLVHDVVIIANGRLVKAGAMSEVMLAARSEAARVTSLEDVFLTMTHQEPPE